MRHKFLYKPNAFFTVFFITVVIFREKFRSKNNDTTWLFVTSNQSIFVKQTIFVFCTCIENIYLTLLFLKRKLNIAGDQ